MKVYLFLVHCFLADNKNLSSWRYPTVAHHFNLATLVFIMSPSSSPDFLSTSIPPSFTCSDSGSAVTALKPISCISCQARTRHWRGRSWKSEISHRLNSDLKIMLMTTPNALRQSFCCLFTGAYTLATSAWLWSCCGLQSLCFPLSLSPAFVK